MSKADSMPFPQYAVAVLVGLVLLAVYFALVAVTLHRLGVWWRQREQQRRREQRPSHVAPSHLGTWR